jgi:hypothetical protein
VVTDYFERDASGAGAPVEGAEIPVEVDESEIAAPAETVAPEESAAVAEPAEGEKVIEKVIENAEEAEKIAASDEGEPAASGEPGSVGTGGGEK